MKRFNKFTQKEKYCILNPHHDMIVKETASQWRKIPYQYMQYTLRACRQRIFGKQKGYILLGFKFEWTTTDAVMVNSDLNGSLGPFCMIFIKEESFNLFFTRITGKGVLVEVDSFGEVNFDSIGSPGTLCEGRRFESSLLAKKGSVLKYLTDSEVDGIKSIDEFASEGWLKSPLFS